MTQNGPSEGQNTQPVVPEQVRQAFERPQDFAKNAMNAIESFLKKNNFSLNTFQQLRPGEQQADQTPGKQGMLDRIMSWLKSLDQTGFMRLSRRGGRNRLGGGRESISTAGRVSPEEPPMGTAEAMQRLQGLKATFPQLQFQMFDRAGIRPIPVDSNPQIFEQFCAHNSIRGADLRSYIQKMELNGRQMQEAARRPGWENPAAWQGNVACDGLRIWAFNPATNETCVATGGQLLFGQGNPNAIVARMGRNQDGDPTTSMRTINNLAVQWDHTAMGERFIAQNNGVRDELFSRHNDGTTRERFTAGNGRPDFIMHTDKVSVARVNTPGAMLPGSMRIEDMRGVQQFPQGTFARMGNGEWLGKTSQEVQKRGLNAYVDMLAKLPDRELASYISGVMFDQNEDAYGPGAPNMRSLNIVFDRTDRTVGDILKSGYGDCRGVAKLVEMVWRKKGYRCVTLAVEHDHMMAVRVVPSGNARAPFVAVGIGNNGYWDKFPPGRTPGEAVANTWTDEKYRRPGAPDIMNDKMNIARSTYDAVGQAILNNA